jgi:hypothetical protein
MTDDMVNQLVAAAANIALLFVGVPHEIMLARLYDLREQVQAQFSAMLGPDYARFVAELFVTAVAGHKAEIEAQKRWETLQ